MVYEYVGKYTGPMDLMGFEQTWKKAHDFKFH